MVDLNILQSIRGRGSQITIGAISGPSKALPSSEALEIPEARAKRRASGGKYLSATSLVLPVPSLLELCTYGWYYHDHRCYCTFLLYIRVHMYVQGPRDLRWFDLLCIE